MPGKRDPRALAVLIALLCGDRGRGAGAEPTPERPPATAAALDEVMCERRVFRQVLVGALRYPPKRLTWVLSRGAGSARLQVFCQDGRPLSVRGLSLDGQEGDEARWLAPTVTSYAGARAGPLLYRLALGPGAATGCETWPGVLLLRCRPEQVAVLAAGAALIPGRKTEDDRMTPARWRPAGRTRVPALRCDLSAEGEQAWPFRLLWTGWPLYFAAGREGAPGIEWAHENSDMVVQEGAYRFLPAPQ